MNWKLLPIGGEVSDYIVASTGRTLIRSCITDERVFTPLSAYLPEELRRFEFLGRHTPGGSQGCLARFPLTTPYSGLTFLSALLGGSPLGSQKAFELVGDRQMALSFQQVAQLLYLFHRLPKLGTMHEFLLQNEECDPCILQARRGVNTRWRWEFKVIDIGKQLAFGEDCWIFYLKSIA